MVLAVVVIDGLVGSGASATGSRRARTRAVRTGRDRLARDPRPRIALDRVTGNAAGHGRRGSHEVQQERYHDKEGRMSESFMPEVCA